MTSVSKQGNSSSLFTTAISFEIAIGFGGLILGILIGPEARALVPQWFEWQAIGFGLFWGTLSAVPLSLFVFTLSLLPLRSIRNLHRIAERQLLPMFREFSWPELILVAWTAGICEEIFFRGWLQCLLTGPLDSSSPWQPKVILGVLVAGIGFGMCHSLTRLYFVLATLAGIFFGILLVETSNLLVPITAHAVYDIVMLAHLRRRIDRSAIDAY